MSNAGSTNLERSAGKPNATLPVTPLLSLVPNVPQLVLLRRAVPQAPPAVKYP
jgi:hypothetical protein